MRYKSGCSSNNLEGLKRRKQFPNYFKANYKKFKGKNPEMSERMIRQELGRTFKLLSAEEKSSYNDGDDVTVKSGNDRLLVDQCEGEQEVGEQKQLSSRCSFDRLIRIIRLLTPEQKEAIRMVGFGNFLREDYPYVCSNLVAFLLDNLDPSNGLLTIYGKTFTLTSATFGEVMGITDGGEDVLMYSCRDISSLRNALVGDSVRLSLSELEKQLGKEQDADELFVTRFVLLVIGCVLCPTSGVHISTGYLHTLYDTQSIVKKNWATYAFKYLLNSISRYVNTGVANISGCTIFLQLFYLHNVEWNRGFVDRTIPPIQFWTNTKCKSIFKWIRSIGGFQSSQMSLAKVKKKVSSTSTRGGRKVESDEVDCTLEIHELKDEIAFLRATVLTFSDHVAQLVEMQVKKIVSELTDHGEKAQPSKRSPKLDHSSTEDFIHDIADIEADASPSYKRKKLGDDLKCCTISVEEKVHSQCVLESEDSDHKEAKKSPIEIVEGKIKTKRNKEKDMFDESCVGRFSKSSGRVVGPFTHKNPVGVRVLNLGRFIFDGNLPGNYLLAKYGKVEVDREYMGCMLPGREIKGYIINCYAQILMDEERLLSKLAKPAFWYMPTEISQNGLGMSMSITRMAREQEWSKNHFGDIDCCEKMIVPMLSNEGARHWVLAELDMKAKTVLLWDSMFTPLCKTRRRKVTLEMLNTLDDLLALEKKIFKEDDFKFSDFTIDFQKKLPQQDNGCDCGLFVMKYMEAISKRQDVVQKFDGNERLRFATMIVDHHLNSVRTAVLRDTEKSFGDGKGSEDKVKDIDDPLEELNIVQVRSPSKSPVDPRWKNKKARANNMFVGAAPVATRTRSIRTRHLGFPSIT